ncbi:MAG: rhomboid family intramembrane serine protease [Planctomycetes bacterium]|nr:rhomboid family intramembrane serine protease [Planctomycetota bacterium]
MKATHVLLGAHLGAFLVLVFGTGSPWQEELIQQLSLGGAEAVIARPWTLLTHLVINVHALEFALSVGLLALAGGAVEDRLGRARFCALYFGTAGLVAFAHLVLREAGLSSGVLAGTLGASCGLLTCYLFLRGQERRRGTISFPLLYLLLCFGILVAVWVVQETRTSELALRAQELVTLAYGALDRSFEQRLLDLERVARLEAIQPATWSHLLGLSLGGLALYSVSVGERVRERLHVLREIHSLQQEVDARARVELLLTKISAEGIDSLSHSERRFLRYASRFYRHVRVREGAYSP